MLEKATLGATDLFLQNLACNFYYTFSFVLGTRLLDAAKDSPKSQRSACIYRVSARVKACTNTPRSQETFYPEAGSLVEQAGPRLGWL